MKPGRWLRRESSGKIVDAPQDVAPSSSIESFLPKCICNVACLLETVVQNTDICRLFIEKNGIEAVLQLFKLPSIPTSVSIGLFLLVSKTCRLSILFL
jgi:hypothetical protein